VRFRLFECGENHVKDLSRWTTPADAGKPAVFADNMAHLTANWEAKRAPSFNYNVEQSVRSMNEMDAFLKSTGARLWINHDMAQSSAIPKAPAFVE